MVIQRTDTKNALNVVSKYIINMIHLESIICNNNLFLVKDTLEKMCSKLLKSTKVNQPLVNELKADIERLNDSYLYFNKTKENALSINNTNKRLDSLVFDARVYIMDLKKENKEKPF